MRYLFASFLIVGIFIIPWFSLTYPDAAQGIAVAVREIGNQVASVILAHNPVSVATLKFDYGMAAFANQPKVRVLIVPGHEPDYGGAEYGVLKERDLNVELSANLMNLLQNNGHYETFTTRYENSWTANFDTYFKNEWNDIVAWKDAHKAEIQDMIRIGKFEPTTPAMYHNDAPTNVALRLYGIDKWANENNMDIVIHVHFNDYPRSNRGPGKYNGFSIYVPERQYANSSTTKALAETIFQRLNKYNPVSNLRGESSGIVEDQELIAIGSFNSVDAASMLIEYSYIYEPQLVDPELRHAFLKELAYETYLGVEDFFEPTDASTLYSAYDTQLLPHFWGKGFDGERASTPEVFVLQTALIDHGDYPPTGDTLNNCPRTGGFGPCTKAALTAFQAKNKIYDEKNTIGPKTARELNQLYSAKVE